MWRPYIEAAEELFPQANIVIDRFHTTQAITECLDSLCKSLRRPETAGIQATEMGALQAVPYLDSQLDLLDERFKASPQLKQAQACGLIQNSANFSKQMPLCQGYKTGMALAPLLYNGKGLILVADSYQYTIGEIYTGNK